LGGLSARKGNAVSRQLTEAEISAPDVVLRIPAGARLPKSVQDLLFGYSGYLRGNYYVYRVAGYVAKDIEQALRAASARIGKIILWRRASEASR